VLVMMTGLGLLSGSSMMVAGGGKSAAGGGGAPVTCMDNLVCSAARVGSSAADVLRILLLLLHVVRCYQ
jgi:hypothetical protein